MNCRGHLQGSTAKVNQDLTDIIKYLVGLGLTAGVNSRGDLQRWTKLTCIYPGVFN